MFHLKIVTAHVHDSGRIKELLYKGNSVSLRKAKDTSKRKTEWDLISAKAEDGEDILLNSSFHRYISLLYKGNSVSLRKAKDTSKRKTEWDLISAKAEDGEDILLNSSFHRYISENILRDGEISPLGNADSVKAEVKYGHSRLDYLLEKDGENVKAEVKYGHSRLDYLLEKDGEKIWIEVKGVSLSENKHAVFPDAPSTSTAVLIIF